MDIFKTSDRGLAAYLLYKGHNCIGCVPSNHADPRRMDFVFIDIADPKVEERTWYAKSKELMSARGYFEALSTVIRMVKMPMTKEEVDKLRG